MDKYHVWYLKKLKVLSYLYYFIFHRIKGSNGMEWIVFICSKKS